MTFKIFTPESSKAVNGVFAYFKKESILNKSVLTFASSTYSPYVPNNILDITSDKFWASLTEDEKYVGFTFIYHSFHVENYTLKQYNGAGHISERWKLQGLKGKTWKDIDSRESKDYCKVGTLPTFAVNKTNEFYRSFRIISPGLACDNVNEMRNAGLELFGTLKKCDPFCDRITIKNVSKAGSYVYFIIMTLLY